MALVVEHGGFRCWLGLFFEGVSNNKTSKDETKQKELTSHTPFHILSSVVPPGQYSLVCPLLKMPPKPKIKNQKVSSVNKITKRTKGLTSKCV